MLIIIGILILLLIGSLILIGILFSRSANKIETIELYKIFIKSLTDDLSKEFNFQLNYLEELKKSEVLYNTPEVVKFVRMTESLIQTYEDLLKEFNDVQNQQK